MIYLNADTILLPISFRTLGNFDCRYAPIAIPIAVQTMDGAKQFVTNKKSKLAPIADVLSHPLPI